MGEQAGSKQGTPLGVRPGQLWKADQETPES